MPGRSLTRPPRTSTTECSCRLWPSPGMYAVISTPFVSRTRAALRSAEFGFFGVRVKTRVQTPRRCGDPWRAGVFVFSGAALRPLRTSWFKVGPECLLVSQTVEGLPTHKEGRQGAGPANRLRHGSERCRAPQTPLDRRFAASREDRDRAPLLAAARDRKSAAAPSTVRRSPRAGAYAGQEFLGGRKCGRRGTSAVRGAWRDNGVGGDHRSA